MIGRKLLIRWAIARMSKILDVWKKLEQPDRMFLFRWLASRHPEEFTQVYSERGVTWR